MPDPVINAAVVAERKQLARDLTTLTADAWNAPTTCGDWDVHDVLAHMVETAKCTRVSFLRDLARARFDFDRANARGVARERRADPAQTLAEFEAVADRTSGPPGPPETRLVEVFVHGEDIRRAIGLSRAYPTAWVARALAYQAAASPSVGGGRELAAGVSLVANDADVRIGDGPEVRGSVLSLLLAMTGRSPAADSLSGPGAARLGGSTRRA